MEIKNLNSSSPKDNVSYRNPKTNITNNTPGNVPVTRVASASSLANMTKGSIFAGDIIDIRGSSIKILLSGNETINAKTSNSSSMNIGDYIKFMIKENNGSQILIKALNVDNRNSNPLFNALESANIPVTERNMQMVLEMMRNEMPIDKNSINNMYKNISMFESVKADTIVNMIKHDIPLNDINAKQFENYTSYEHRISEEINSISKEIPDMLHEALKSDISEKLIKNTVSSLIANYPNDNILSSTNLGEINLVIDEQIDISSLDMDDLVDIQNSETNLILGEETVTNSSSNISDELNSLIDKMNEKLLASMDTEELNAKDLISKDIVNKDTFVKAMSILDKEDLNQLFDTKEFRKLIKNSIEKDLIIDVSKLTGDGDDLKNKLIKLYDSLDDKTKSMLEIMKNIPEDSKNISARLENIRNNLSFMSDLNQMAAYVQLPLKFNENTEHGELYVYNKNKNKTISKDVVTAFMHLDMESLGVTDVDIRLENDNLSTSFTLADDLSVSIVNEHINELKDRLTKAGFSVSLDVKLEDKYENPFEKVLNAEQPKKAIMRYSFDVRA